MTFSAVRTFARALGFTVPWNISTVSDLTRLARTGALYFRAPSALLNQPPRLALTYILRETGLSGLTQTAGVDLMRSAVPGLTWSNGRDVYRNAGAYVAADSIRAGLGDSARIPASGHVDWFGTQRDKYRYVVNATIQNALTGEQRLQQYTVTSQRMLSKAEIQQDVITMFLENAYGEPDDVITNVKLTDAYRRVIK